MHHLVTWKNDLSKHFLTHGSARKCCSQCSFVLVVEVTICLLGGIHIQNKIHNKLDRWPDRLTSVGCPWISPSAQQKFQFLTLTGGNFRTGFWLCTRCCWMAQEKPPLQRRNMFINYCKDICKRKLHEMKTWNTKWYKSVVFSGGLVNCRGSKRTLSSGQRSVIINNSFSGFVLLCRADCVLSGCGSD